MSCFFSKYDNSEYWLVNILSIGFYVKIQAELSGSKTKVNETDELEERIEVLENAVLLLQDELNDVRVDIDDLETQDSLIDVRMLSVEADVLRNEDEIEGIKARLDLIYVDDSIMILSLCLAVIL